jgi:DNA-directed RNA polymerase specialized sigma24 family protein
MSVNVTPMDPTAELDLDTYYSNLLKSALRYTRLDKATQSLINAHKAEEKRRETEAAEVAAEKEVEEEVESSSSSSSAPMEEEVEAEAPWSQLTYEQRLTLVLKFLREFRYDFISTICNRKDVPVQGTHYLSSNWRLTL